MRVPLLFVFTAATLLASPAMAENNSSPTQAKQPNSTTGAMTEAQKIKQDLQSAGFTNVNVVAESFAVTAKTKDGNQVYMTFGPAGMSAFEAVGTVPSNGAAGNSGSAPSSHQSGSK